MRDGAWVRWPAGAELASVVGFLLRLGFQEAGRPHPLAALSPKERSIAGHLAQLGLLYAFRCAPPPALT